MERLIEAILSLQLPHSTHQTCFDQLQAIFMARSVTLQKRKFTYVIEKLPTKVASEVLDLLDTVPEGNPYNMLRQTILHLAGESEEKKLLNLFSNVSIGNRKLSQILRHMRSLLEPRTLPENILQQLWLNKLLNHVTQILIPWLGDTDLDKLAYKITSKFKNVYTHDKPPRRHWTSSYKFLLYTNLIKLLFTWWLL